MRDGIEVVVEGAYDSRIVLAGGLGAGRGRVHGWVSNDLVHWDPQPVRLFLVPSPQAPSHSQLPSTVRGLRNGMPIRDAKAFPSFTYSGSRLPFNHFDLPHPSLCCVVPDDIPPRALCQYQSPQPDTTLPHP